MTFQISAKDKDELERRQEYIKQLERDLASSQRLLCSAIARIAVKHDLTTKQTIELIETYQ